MRCFFAGRGGLRVAFLENGSVLSAATSANVRASLR
jgi:hypothetical protein